MRIQVRNITLRNQDMRLLVSSTEFWPIAASESPGWHPQTGKTPFQQAAPGSLLWRASENTLSIRATEWGWTANATETLLWQQKSRSAASSETGEGAAAPRLRVVAASSDGLDFTRLVVRFRQYQLFAFTGESEQAAGTSSQLISCWLLYEGRGLRVWSSQFYQHHICTNWGIFSAPRWFAWY